MTQESKKTRVYFWLDDGTIDFNPEFWIEPEEVENLPYLTDPSLVEKYNDTRKDWKDVCEEIANSCTYPAGKPWEQ